ncbi:restriction endonuclease subunit S [Stutzerimonas stutzeri]|uniref:restriction endonuclease subunit S n=1 Tax=Stutzerimonas stutzeri TaxID=316 RepID=UPI00036025F9|nr:restriction endonuclease subunit S [Stutzerimonas stutzeri]
MIWPLVQLGDVAPAKASKHTFAETDDVWTLNLDQIEADTGKVLQKIIAPASEAGSSTHGFDERHVLYSKLRPYLNKVVLPNDKGLATTELVPMLPDADRLERKYLAYYLRSKGFVDWVSAQVAGAKMPRVSMLLFWQHEIPLPPLSEQKRIAAILDKADAIRRKRQQAIKLADDFLRAVFLDMFGDPVTNPKGLRVVPLISICEKVTDGTHQSPKWESSGVPFLFISNIVDGKINYDTNKFISGETFAELTRTTLIEKGDILYTTVGSYGNVAVVPGDRDFCFQRHIAHIKPSRQMVDPQFLAGMLSSSVVRQQADRLVRGVAQKTLNLRELKEIKVFDLPMKDQENYLRIIDPINKVAERQLFSGRELDKKFNALSQKAFLGQL